MTALLLDRTLAVQMGLKDLVLTRLSFLSSTYSMILRKKEVAGSKH